MREKTTNGLREYRCWKSMLLPERRGAGVADVVRNCIALNATAIQDAYLALYNRMDYFTRQMFEESLYHSGDMGRLRAMRKGLYLIPKEDFELIFSSTYRYKKHFIEQNQKLCNISESEYTTIARTILNELAGGEKKRAQLLRKMPSGITRTIEIGSGRNVITSLNVDIVLDWLLNRWQVVPGIETWGKTAPRFRLFDSLYPAASYSMDYDTAEQELVLRYITQYGPVHSDDICWWCELTASRVRRILSALSSSLTELSISGLDGAYYITNSLCRHFRSFNTSLHESILFLGRNDPLFMGYRLNEPNIPPKYADAIFSQFGQAEPVVLLNGAAAGTWTCRETQVKIEFSITLFRKLSAKLEDKMCMQIDCLGDFLGGEDKTTNVTINYV